MIDRLMCAIEKDDFTFPYNETEAVTGSNLLNPEAKDLKVFFPPKQGGGRIMQLLGVRIVQTFVRRMSHQNAVLEYRFHDRVLEPNVERVPLSFEVIRDKVVRDLSEIQDKAQYESIHFVGMSLGNIALAMVAEEFPNFTGATLVTPVSNMAAAMWDGLRTQQIRQILSEQGVTKGELDEAWHNLAPISHAPVFKNKDVKTQISLADKMIPLRYQMEMADALEEGGSNLERSYSLLGHTATLTRFCIKG